MKAEHGTVSVVNITQSKCSTIERYYYLLRLYSTSAEASNLVNMLACLTLVSLLFFQQSLFLCLKIIVTLV